MTMCIIGGGTYGCYLAKVLSEAFPEEKITILEVGTEKTVSESDVGFTSSTKGMPYSALTEGRYFGLGGSSARWGGQLLTFTANDFARPSRFLSDIVELNERHSERVLSRFGLHNDEVEDRLSPELFVKTGCWLGYRKRNLYSCLKISSLKNVHVRTKCRVIRLLSEKRTVVGIEVRESGEVAIEKFDRYFLATGAFESNRLLAVSEMMDPEFRFSDHLSQRAFLIRGSTKIGTTDFRFKFKGGSLVTKRLVGEVDDVSFFAHPIFNVDFPFFQSLKRILFQRKATKAEFLSLLRYLPGGLAFFFNMFILRRLYVHGRRWYLQLDIENFKNSGSSSPSQELDGHGQFGLQVELNVGAKTDEIFEAARARVRSLLESAGADFKEVRPNTETKKYEDTYHPYGMFGSDSDSAEEFFSRFTNLLVVNTGILPRAGGINCTAAVFPLLEEYVRILSLSKMHAFDAVPPSSNKGEMR